VVTGRPSVALPAGGILVLLQVADAYNVTYLVLEPKGTSQELQALYNNPQQFPAFQYLGESDGNRLFKIQR
jgi:hypothetical protein